MLPISIPRILKRFSAVALLGLACLPSARAEQGVLRVSAIPDEVPT
jgi:hypothetical protein